MPPSLIRRLGLRSATALVVANIVGAGIFTTTGFQAADLGHPVLIYALWVVGGLLALAGALCYAELGAAMPQAGAEYVYLRETFGPALAFMSAFVSLMAGFSGPIAAAAKSFMRYAAHLMPNVDVSGRVLGVSVEDLGAIVVVWILIAVHFRGVRGGYGFNDAMTLIKVVGIVGIIVAAVTIGRGQVENLVAPSAGYADLQQTGALLPALATSLVFVMFCYAGFNASAYVASEMENPQRDLPRSLLIGTSIVALLYLGLNFVYFYGAGVDELAGQVEVGLVASRQLFGGGGVNAVTLILCISILASASAMTIAGPRVYYSFGRDYPPLRALARVHPRTGAPTAALVLQGIVTSALIVSGRVDQIQQYAGLTISLFASLAVSCVIVLRIRRPDMPRPFRTWGYPMTPIVFLGVSAWMMFWAYQGRPVESTLALGTVGVGGAAFFLLSRRGSE
ncbi:MAG: APC family permease [Acidobacteriota bacterium]|nr:APC family permease [Acidobacteriota bacterium]